ncbi:hypothetical protein [Methyloglobulus sp.]|uniref:hypothetical protein n=1 Tax=Methyloglobulus sp. TaxID=2518622 RepID=UPI0032B82756
MTRRDVGMLCNSTPQTALRGIAQPYRFWGLKIFTPLTLRFHDFQRSKIYMTHGLHEGQIKKGNKVTR